MRLQSNTVVREFLTTGTISALIDGSLGSLYLVLLFLLSPPLAALVLGLALLQVMVLLLARRRNQHLMSESLQVEAKSQSYTFELLAGIETLKAAGAERRAAEHWERLFTDQVNVALRRGRLEASVEAVTGTLQVGSPLAILVYGGFQVLNGSLSLGTMLAFAALAAGFLEPLATMIDTGLKLQLLRSYMERISDVLDASREQEGQEVATAHRLSGRVTAEGVSFSYGPLAPAVVRDVSLEVQPGHQLGIAGRSGSGKSTLASLLLGMYPPISGRILFDGRDLAKLEVKSLRSQIGIVTQRPYLFGATIRQNIALSNPAMPDEMVVEAAKLACVHDEIVAMPMGYETPLVDGGASLSGGQQQRIALARALAHRPTILLLDEATSDLDSVTERMVHRNLSTLGCTRIVIAHRLSTIVDADLILVMEEGRIVQRGTHDELMALPGAYRAQVLTQQMERGEEATVEQELSRRHPSALAEAYRAAGRTEEAAALHEQILATRQRVLGPDHPSTLGARNNLANALRAAGRTEEAVALHEQVLAVRQRVLGPEHPDTVQSRNNLIRASADAASGRLPGRAARVPELPGPT
jgi:ATP-binding cassette, subfamily B, bacterial